MNYLIDGHNLIPKLPGLSLDMPDDEQRLLELLLRFCQQGGHRAEVYFDGASPGQSGARSFGRVRAHFVPQSATADEAIRRRLTALGKSSRTWSVVSSDRQVQSAARAARTRVLTAESFVGRLQSSLEESASAPDEPLSEAEVREWEQVFKGPHKRNPG